MNRRRVSQHVLARGRFLFTLKVDETGRFDCTCTPALQNCSHAQRAEMREYLEPWLSQVASGYARKHGHGKASVQFASTRSVLHGRFAVS